MIAELMTGERRAEIRTRWDDVIRWKRPGRIEDCKAWAVDRSVSGIGFMTEADHAPAIGDVLHVRRMDMNRWSIANEVVRVARVAPTSGGQLTMVGCVLSGPNELILAPSLNPANC